jgi:hypothetical protein
VTKADWPTFLSPKNLSAFMDTWDYIGVNRENRERQQKHTEIPGFVNKLSKSEAIFTSE